MNNHSNVKVNIVFSLFFAFVMFIFAPFELYLSNKTFFFFEGQELIEVCLLAFVASTVFLVVALCLLGYASHKLYFGATIILFGTTLALYIQGNFLPNDYGELDGKAIDWSGFVGEGIISIASIVVIAVFLTIICCKFERQKVHKALMIVAVCIVLEQLLTLSILMIQKDGLSKNEVAIATEIEQTNYSSDENIIVLMLDSYDATVFNQIINGDDGEIYQDILENFTFYRDNSGIFQSTNYSLMYMLSGEMYHNDRTTDEYDDWVYRESPVLNRLKDNNWWIGMYNNNRLPNTDAALICDNIRLVKLNVSSHRRLAEYMYKLVLFRYLPQPLKKYFWIYPDDIYADLSDNDEGYEPFSGNNYKFHDSVGEIEGDMTQKKFSFITLGGAHVPYFMDENGNKTDVETDAMQVGKGCLKIVEDYLASLKMNGIYDNSTIIIMADHGTRVNSNPLFLVKYRNNMHSFNVDDTPISFASLQDIFKTIIEGGNEDQCKAVWERYKTQERVVYRFDNEGHTQVDDDYCPPIKEYRIGGFAGDGKLVETGVTYTAQN